MTGRRVSKAARATRCALRVGRRSGSGLGQCQRSSGSIGKTALAGAAWRLDQHSRSRLRQLPGRVVRSVLGVGSLPDRYRFRPRLTTRFTLPLFARTAPNPGFSEVTRPLLAPLE
jgi:hypothetical protein